MFKIVVIGGCESQDITFTILPLPTAGSIDKQPDRLPWAWMNVSWMASHHVCKHTVFYSFLLHWYYGNTPVYCTIEPYIQYTVHVVISSGSFHNVLSGGQNNSMLLDFYVAKTWLINVWRFKTSSAVTWQWCNAFYANMHLSSDLRSTSTT